MMSFDEAHKRVQQLCDHFDSRRDEIMSSEYKEATVRAEFITPFFEELGWDVNNTAHHTIYEKDCVLEKAEAHGGTQRSADYAFRRPGTHLTAFFVEAKKPSVDIRRGARVNTISPGIIITPVAKDELTGPRGEGYRRMIELSAVGRAGTLDEVGAVGERMTSSPGIIPKLCASGDFSAASRSHQHSPFGPGSSASVWPCLFWRHSHRGHTQAVLGCARLDSSWGSSTWAMGYSISAPASCCCARCREFGCDAATIKDKIMKLLFFAAGLLCLIAAARGADDEQPVREVVKSFVTDYNNGNFKNAPSYTTDDWVHINPGGGITRGRDEVLKEVRAIHKTMLRGVSIMTESMTVHFVTHDVALVNAIHKSDSYVTPEDGMKHENERQMKTYVVVKHNGKWLLALDQNTIIYNP